MRTRAATLKVWAALLAVMAAAMVIALALGSEPAHAAFPGSTGDIAFTFEGDDPPTIIPQIYRMGADGYDPKRLSDTTGLNSDPAWSSDGTMISFTNTQTNSEVYVMDHDGDPEVNVTDHPANDLHPAFFPGQRKIAFTSDRLDAQNTTDQDIFALTFDANMNTIEVIQLTKNNNEDLTPAVSPNGTKIAFASNRDGDYDIYVMKAAPESATNVPKKLTKNTAFTDAEPDWSPDGRRIVFTSDRDGGDKEIIAMNADGTNQKNLTKNSADDYEPVFSPDGRKIAFTSNRVDLKQVWRMRADGTNPVQLTFAAGPAGIKGFLPAWQPIS
jgi:Tol biopolymer transport system component